MFLLLLLLSFGASNATTKKLAIDVNLKYIHVFNVLLLYYYLFYDLLSFLVPLFVYIYIKFIVNLLLNLVVCVLVA